MALPTFHRKITKYRALAQITLYKVLFFPIGSPLTNFVIFLSINQEVIFIGQHGLRTRLRG